MATAQKNPAQFRSKATQSFVREITKKDGTTQLIQADLPVGIGWGDGTALTWINNGWEIEDNYKAKKLIEQVAVERAALEAEKSSLSSTSEEPKKKGK